MIEKNLEMKRSMGGRKRPHDEKVNW